MLPGSIGSLAFLASSEGGFQRSRKRHVGKDPRLGFEIIDIRRFEPKEFSDLLEAESRAWNDTLRWDFAASARVINACLRDKRLSGYALVGEEGFAATVSSSTMGKKGLSATSLCTRNWRAWATSANCWNTRWRRSWGRPVCGALKPSFRTMSARNWSPASCPAGSRAYLRRFMSLSLEGPQQAAGAEPRSEPTAEKPWVREDIELIPWEKRFHDDAAELLYQSYRQHVDALINDQYASVMGATRLIENIFHNQGCGDFLTRVSRMAVHRPTQQLAGILTVTGVRPRTAHIPQVGVGPSFQGLGVGTALMEAAFQDLARGRL